MITRRELHEIAARIQRREFPHLEVQPMMCSWSYSRTLDEQTQRTEYKCAECGDTQIVQGLLGDTERRVCRA